METAAKMNEQLATGRFACGCEIVDADLSADERGHVAVARGGRSIAVFLFIGVPTTCLDSHHAPYGIVAPGENDRELIG